MPENTQNVTCDILIAGAGFAGSLAAMALHQSGFEVCLVEKHTHPRFAIGESSTPIADMILRKLADQYDLPWLGDFSRYGSWQQSHPEITCGIKRGFSYYKHTKGPRFSTDTNHTNELLVAASPSDQNSDTNWLRSDFDAFLVKKVQDYGIPYFDRTEILAGERENKWKFTAAYEGDKITFHADFFIDATGSSALLANLLDIKSSDEEFLTNSRALYSHFDNLSRWSEYLESQNIASEDYPYDPDLSALHHLIDEGWLWMLRFNNERTSAGLVLDCSGNSKKSDLSPEEEWRSVISSYPSLKKIFETAEIAKQPGQIIRTGRLQRKLSQATGQGWAALPHTAGFVDPLHSTGIAHTLCGVEKLVNILSANWGREDELQSELTAYEEAIFEELALIDLLVSGCYRVSGDFELFHIWSMLYFTAAIAYEQRRLKGERPTHFLMAGNSAIQKIVEDSYANLKGLLDSAEYSPCDIAIFQESVKEKIEPWNIAGLLNPEVRNMYHHTVAEL